MDDTAKSSDPLGIIYEAATDYRKWPMVLATLTKHLGSGSAALYFIDSKNHNITFLATAGIEKETIEHLRDSYKTSQIFERLISRSPVGEIFSANEMGISKGWARDPLFAQVFKPAHLNHFFSEILIRDDLFTALITFHGAEGAAPFNDRQLGSYGLLSPHIKRAVSMLRQFNALESQRQGMSDLLQRLPLGVILLNRDGQVIETNKRAEKMLNEGEGFQINRSRHLKTDRSKSSNALKTSIANAIGDPKNPEHRVTDALSIESSSGRTLNLLVAPLRRPPAIIANRSPSAVVFIGDPGGDSGSSIATLRKLHGLTRSEARLAEALAKGKKIKEISVEFGVSVSTLRSQLHSAFSKTGENNQSGLVRLVLSGPASYENQDAN